MKEREPVKRKTVLSLLSIVVKSAPNAARGVQPSTVRAPPDFHKMQVTVVAASTLALGIGFSTTLYAIVNGMGSGPTVPDAERVVSLASLNPAEHHVGVSYLDFKNNWRPSANAFDGLAAYSGATMNLTDRGLVRGAHPTVCSSPHRRCDNLEEQPVLGREFAARRQSSGRRARRE